MKASAAVYWAALVTALLLPFAAIPPLVDTDWLALTDDKLVLLVLVGAWLSLGRRALPSRHEWRALAPTAALILVALISASLAPPDYASEALRYLSRLLGAAFLMLVALRLGRDAPKKRGLLWAIAIGGGISGLLGLGEALRWPALEPLLALFKVAPTRVGGELRVSASFQYATIASMYFEMVAPLAVVLAGTTRRWWLQVLGVAIAVVCTANVVLSLTRAGMLTLLAIYAVLLAVAVTRRSWRRVLLRPAAAGAVALLGGAALLLIHDPVFELRLTTESDADWYGAAYSAPASVEVLPNQQSTVELDVRNEGRITWTSTGNHPFALGYRWLTDDGDGVLDIPPAEVQLSHDVEPGETIHLQAAVHVPNLPSGSYRLDWGMLQRDVLQFYERGWADAETRVVVDADGSATMMPDVLPRDDAEAPWVVGRVDLWGAAMRLIAAHPIIGVGPDNFRHFYGEELGLEVWDERIQANNLYLEVLADLGVLGLAAFGWVVVEALRGVWLGATGKEGSRWRAATALRLTRYTQHTDQDQAAAARAASVETDTGGAHQAQAAAKAGGASGGGANASGASPDAPHPAGATPARANPGETAPALALGVGLAMGAFLFHGLLDAFLAFTPTALLFWLLLGLAQKPQVSGR